MSGCEHYGNGLVICRTEMEEIRRRPWETRWCFQCRQRLSHEAVVVAPTDPMSYYGPSVEVRCSGCGEDHVHFPGTWDGPTLELAE